MSENKEPKDFTAIEWGQKLLPRDELTGNALTVFPTDKREYFIKADHISPRRWTIFQQLTGEIERGRSISDTGKWAAEHMAIVNGLISGKTNVSELVLHTNELLEGMKHDAHMRYNRALYLCTLFVLYEGEDVTKWDLALAESKIDDWNDYGYSVDDFFQLAAIFTPQLASVLTSITANILLSSQVESENSQFTENTP